MEDRHDQAAAAEGVEPQKVWQKHSKITIVLNFINK